MLAADGEHLAVDGHGGEAEQVVGGDAVFQAVRATRVHADIAADHAGELAGRVGRVEEALGLHRLGDADVGDARLHGGAAVGVVDVQDAVHAHHADHHGVRERHGPARQAGPGPARDDAHAHRVAQLQHGGDLPGRFRQCDGEWHLAVGGQPVRLVRLEPERLADHAAIGEDSAEAGHDLVAPGEHVGFRLWQSEHGVWRSRTGLCINLMMPTRSGKTKLCRGRLSCQVPVIAPGQPGGGPSPGGPSSAGSSC